MPGISKDPTLRIPICPSAPAGLGANSSEKEFLSSSVTLEKDTKGILFVTPRNISQISFAPKFPSLLKLYFPSYQNPQTFHFSELVTLFFLFPLLWRLCFCSENPSLSLFTQASC